MSKPRFVNFKTPEGNEFWVNPAHVVMVAVSLVNPDHSMIAFVSDDAECAAARMEDVIHRLMAE